MPRRPRLDIPGIPMHLTHRGVNRAATFLEPGDPHAYLAALQDAMATHAVRVHAYVLMSNHVHLLVSADGTGAVGRAMRDVGRAYVPAFNRRHGRTGTLWEGRFKSCLVDTDDYLLRAYRYIELNPVRAAMVERPEEHPRSSVHANLGLRADALVTPHPLFAALGCADTPRAVAYRAWLDGGIAADELQGLRRHMQQERAWGSPRFQAMVEETLQRPARCRSRGRPPKPPAEDAD
jgi:putative transposase